MDLEIANLVKISKKIGSRLDYVQGGGGNTSVKIEPNLMAIKASGYKLENVELNDGLAFVKYVEIAKQIAEFCKNKNGGDDKFNAFVKSSCVNIDGFTYLRPSMETGFHSIINYKYVAHTHSVYTNVLCSIKNAKEIIKKIFGDEAVFVSYCNPGWQITEGIFNTNTKNHQIIFLQNHGLIVAAESADQLFNLHEEVNNKVKVYLGLQNFDPDNIKLYDHEIIRKNILFPDQIVYGLFDKLAQSEVGHHTFLAYSYILNQIERLKLEPVYIEEKNIEFVTNMESEKYRREVAQ